ncbi:CLUMA_CG009290, isoform A [Clunio marinus]|uniref:CLUMA_CG009290, isoform A n=1 Tax=Clunio marinus TaxID=568069 RepID=A0A1J1IBM6_9DIPT|nr:CLUMA_CG009290, isoform A [Clunio marinus]
MYNLSWREKKFLSLCRKKDQKAKRPTQDQTSQHFLFAQVIADSQLPTIDNIHDKCKPNKMSLRRENDRSLTTRQSHIAMEKRLNQLNV